MLLLLAACGGAESPGGSPAEALAAAAPASSAEADGRRRVLAIQGPERSRWSAPVGLGLVPAAAANLPDGRVLLWSARDRFEFGGDLGLTYTATLNPATGAVTERLVQETVHDMFCPGTSILPDGRLLVSGGSSAARTSLYDPVANSWSAGAAITIPRAYHANTVLADGSVFMIGGSWAGGIGGKHGELWTQETGWRTLDGVRVDSMLSPDPSRGFGMDSHFWLLPTGDGRVLYAGPGVEMQWIDARGLGSVQPAGRRADDEVSITGNAVMYDAGRILKTGGATSYSDSEAHAHSVLLEVQGGTVMPRRIVSMAYRRAFHNSVVLPNGQVVVVGGATRTLGFSDAYAVMVPELFDPATESFTPLPALTVPRTYHGVALLLPDARVLVAGGGLCGAGCEANHPDYQILSPYYLFNADGSSATRPVINSAPAQAVHGSTINVSTSSAVTAFSIVRLSAATHGVNNDQRRLSLAFRSLGNNNYQVDIPGNPGWAVPGPWMLFASNAAGTPSVSRALRIHGTGAPAFTPPGDQIHTRGIPVVMDLQATGATGFAATGLPAGLVIDPTTGRIQGTPTAAGTRTVQVTASNAAGATSWEMNWSIQDPAGVRFVRLEAVSEVSGGPSASMAEFNLLDANGNPLPRAGWLVQASSAETSAENGSASLAIDGNPATAWHSQILPTPTPHPHRFTVDLGSPQRISGLRYLPRTGGGSGTVALWRLLTSVDGVTWNQVLASGDLRDLGSAAEEKTVYFNHLARGAPATQSSTYDGITGAGNAVDGNAAGSYSAGSMTHTAGGEANPWWSVDLGGQKAVHAVRLWNRTDCCDQRLSNYHVFVAASPMAGRSLAELLADPAVRRVSVPGTSGRITTLPMAANGRYVRVQLATSDYLQLAEVEVFGRNAGNSPPLLTTPSAQTSTQGLSASLDLFASDPDGHALSWQASGLPPGLSLNTASGRISGVPTTAGGYNVQVSVSDGQGGNTTASFAWTVQATATTVAPVAAPAIVAGASASYTATATGSGLQYSWDFGDGSPATPFSTNPSITRAFGLAGIYTVTLSVRNSAGTITTHRFYQAVQPGANGARAPASSTVAVETRSNASARLWVVNTDNDSVTVFDLATNARVAEINVGARPRSLAVAGNGRVWVVNGGPASISLINTSTLTVAQTIALPAASQPWGLVLAGDGSAFVALEATGRVLKLASTGTVSANVAVAGARHLGLSADGTRLLVSRFITAPQPGEATASVQTTLGATPTGGEVVELSPSNLAERRRFTLRFGTAPDTTIGGRGVPNYLGAAAIAPDGRSAWVPSKQDNIQRGTLRGGSTQNLDFQTTVRAISSRLDLVAQAEDFAGRIDHDNAGVASAAVYHPGGAYLFVALETNRQVAVLDANGKRELFRINVGRAPQGLVLAPDGRRLLVHNFMDRSVSSIQLAQLLDRGLSNLPAAQTLNAVASERLPANVLRGKQFFYDARDIRLARDSYISCASCHNDGGQDGRTWDFTGFGEGLRNTVALRGRAGSVGGHGRQHWTGNFDEVQDFEAQIRSLAGGTGLMSNAQFQTGTRSQPLGDAKAGVSADLDALAAYVNSLTEFDPSPWRLNGVLSAAASTGQVLFASRCASCHGGNAFTDSAGNTLRNVGTLKPGSGQRLGAALTGLDTPTLRDAWATAPYLHDGSAATLEDAIRAHTSLNLPAAEVAPLAAFVREMGSAQAVVAPVVPASNGLKGEYFSNIALEGSPVLVRNEAIDFNWGTGSPGAGVPVDQFSVRWSGTVIPTATGSWRFQTTADDGVRLWVNNVRVVNNWVSQAPTTTTTSNISLTAGVPATIRVEYFENGFGAEVRLRWRPPGSSSFVIVPPTQLRP